MAVPTTYPCQAQLPRRRHDARGHGAAGVDRAAAGIGAVTAAAPDVLSPCAGTELSLRSRIVSQVAGDGECDEGDEAGSNVEAAQPAVGAAG